MIRATQTARKLPALLIAACIALPGADAIAADRLILQLKWTPQAQFAGYYVAQSKGYYKAENLEVTVTPGGPNVPPVQAFSRNAADVAVMWLPEALAAREAGVPVVNIAQIFNRSGLMLICRKSSGITGPKDFKGKKLGVWYSGNELPFLTWMRKLGYRANSDVTVVRQGFDVDLLVNRQADCISAMSYNEYWKVVDAGIKESELISFPYEKMGSATLEDGLYALESRLADPVFSARLGRFLRASFRGWKDSLKNPAEAGGIVAAADPSGSLGEKFQARQMRSVAGLITNAGSGTFGYLEPAAYERTVGVLLADGNTSVIRKAPGKAAYTHAVWEAARK